MNKIILERLLRIWVYVLNPLAVLLTYKAYAIDCYAFEYESYCQKAQSNYILLGIALLFSPLFLPLAYSMFNLVWIGRKPKKEEIKHLTSCTLNLIKQHKVFIVLSIVIAFTFIFNTD